MNVGSEIVFNGIKGIIKYIRTIDSGQVVYYVSLEDNSYNIKDIYLKQEGDEWVALTTEEIMSLTKEPKRMPQ